MLQGQRYCLTWLIWFECCTDDNAIHYELTSSYINNIFINHRLAATDQIKVHLVKFGLAYKIPKWIKDRAQVLGLHIQNNGSRLCWAWGGDTEESPAVMMQRTFPQCGKICWSFTCSRLAPHGDSIYEPSCQQVTNGWDDKTNKTPPLPQRSMLVELLARVHSRERQLVCKWKQIQFGGTQALLQPGSHWKPTDQSLKCATIWQLQSLTICHLVPAKSTGVGKCCTPEEFIFYELGPPVEIPTDKASHLPANNFGSSCMTGLDMLDFGVPMNQQEMV